MTEENKCPKFSEHLASRAGDLAEVERLKADREANYNAAARWKENALEQQGFGNAKEVELIDEQEARKADQALLGEAVQRERREARAEGAAEAYLDAVQTLQCEFGCNSLNDAGLLAYQRCETHWKNMAARPAPAKEPIDA